jgi:nicotinate-nucleotide pyrophosphorylase (carboxylating)
VLPPFNLFECDRRPLRTPFLAMSLSRLTFEPIVRAALLEDIGSGDITTLATIPEDSVAVGTLLAKSRMVLCGIEVARRAFELVDENVSVQVIEPDGTRLAGNREVIARITGRARSILTAERVALNFLQRMSGVATITATFVAAIAGTDAKVVDTRKTTPGLRMFEKYAVKVGGGANHRFGLADGVLIKDNHIAAAGGVGRAIEAARQAAPHTLRIEAEAKELSQVVEALDAGADIIMLDNMSLEEMCEAIAMIGKRAIVEASGGVNLSTIRAIAETGVDRISVGALTHSAPAVDISLDFATGDTR